MSKIIVLGSGMVGSAMAIDMAKKHQVTLCDLSQKTLTKLKKKHKNLDTKQLDVNDKKALKSTIQKYDLVICAVPGFLGFETLKNIIKAKKDVIDISFFPENSLELDALAKEKKVTAIVDCGVAPGMDNVILGYYNEKMKLTDFECLVGGLPKNKKWVTNIDGRIYAPLPLERNCKLMLISDLFTDTEKDVSTVGYVPGSELFINVPLQLKEAEFLVEGSIKSAANGEPMIDATVTLINGCGEEQVTVPVSHEGKYSMKLSKNCSQ